MKKKEELPYIVLLTHGNWGEEIVKGAEMICGSMENTYTFSLFPEQSMENYIEEIEKLLKDAPRGSIIIVDLYGGTTSNVAAIISSNYDILALSGLDIAMLIAADELRTKYKGEELGQKILERSIDNSKNIKKILSETQSEI